ncbi:MAG TPA: hypothetical protein VK550_08960 [Polyangiaceae bacterium]|nr:hypothetical protein [Polyangiaceae bacterium]
MRHIRLIDFGLLRRIFMGRIVTDLITILPVVQALFEELHRGDTDDSAALEFSPPQQSHGL